jgi:hypothetical protein
MFVLTCGIEGMRDHHRLGFAGGGNARKSVNHVEDDRKATSHVKHVITLRIR